MSAAVPPVGSSVPGNTPISDEARKAAAKALLDEGGGPGNSFHSWRCEFPDRYGPCDCVNEVTRSMLSAAAPLLVSAEAERQRSDLHESMRGTHSALNEVVRLQAELDRIAKLPIIAYTLDLEAQIEGLCAELAERDATITQVREDNTGLRTELDELYREVNDLRRAATCIWPDHPTGVRATTGKLFCYHCELPAHPAAASALLRAAGGQAEPSDAPLIDRLARFKQTMTSRTADPIGMVSVAYPVTAIAWSDVLSVLAAAAVSGEQATPPTGEQR